MYNKNEAILYFSFFKFLLKRMFLLMHVGLLACVCLMGVQVPSEAGSTHCISCACSNCSHSPSLYFLLFKLHLIYSVGLSRVGGQCLGPLSCLSSSSGNSGSAWLDPTGHSAPLEAAPVRGFLVGCGQWEDAGGRRKS